MKTIIRCAWALLLAATGHPQHARIPGYNVGLNPAAFLSPTTWMGQFGFYLMIPGNQTIATFYDPATLPAGTVTVSAASQW